MKKLYSTLLAIACMLLCGANAWADTETVWMSNIGSGYSVPVAPDGWKLTLTSTSKKDQAANKYPSNLADFITEGLGSGKLYSTSLSSGGLITLEIPTGYKIEKVTIGLANNSTGSSSKQIGHAAFSADGGATYDDYTNISASGYDYGTEITLTPSHVDSPNTITFGRGAIGSVSPSANSEGRVFYITVEYSAKAAVDNMVTEITGVTINGESLSADDFATLNEEGHALTLDNTYIAAPEVVLTATTTTTYVNGATSAKTEDVTATVAKGEGNTFVATATVGDVVYTITVNKNVEPALEANPTAVTLVSEKVNKATATIHVTGANLSGDAVTITLPDVEGLTCDKTSLSITEGSVSADIVLTYQSNDDVAESTVELTLTAGETSAAVAVTYSSTAALTEIVSINDETTWDWANANETQIQLTAETGKGTDVVLGNWDGWAAGFKADALMVNGEYLNRTNVNPHCFQGSTITFNTTVDGDVTVKYSNTGGNNGTRTVCVNGATIGDGSTSTSPIETSAVPVNAGNVVISGLQTAEGGNTAVGNAAQLRIYSIKFVKLTDGIESVAVDAENAAPVYYNLQGVRVAQPTNGAYIVVRGSKVSKEFIR